MKKQLREKGEDLDNRTVAAGTLRRTKNQTSRKHLALIVSGRAPEIVVQVTVGDGQRPGQLVTASVPLGYARWGVDTGGFIAIATLSDQEIATESTDNTPEDPDDPDMVRISRRDGEHEISQDTGIFLNLVPKNYPIFAISLGFSANEDQPNTFYLAGGVRHLSFNNRMVASFSLGATMRSVKRFPGLYEGLEVNADDPRLQGKSQFKFAPCLVVQLGFAFGRIPGVQDDQ